ncbi:MAG: NAD(P)/FAD-dependent oxidoreductase [Candidatus Methanospirareceae archaeon]
MKEERHDVVVVGAGPAGSVTARRAAELGLDVLVIERNQEIGVPVRCAEGVSKEVEKFVKLDESCICAKIRGARIYSPDGTEVVLKREDVGGYVVERRIFDKLLAREAVRAGAEVRVKTRAYGIIEDGGHVKGVYARCMGEDMRIFADVVVGADGVESRVGRWAGLDTRLRAKDIAVCAEFFMADIEVEDEYCDFFLGNEIAPKGYAWVFPKGEDCANVGVGIGGDASDEGRRAIDFLRKFVKSKFPKGEVIAEIYGAVPISGPIYKTVADGIVLVGDAARQTDPLTGGGIIYAMRAGEMAAEVIAEASKEKDFSKERLGEYEKRWRRELGRKLEKSLKAKDFFLSLSDEKLNKLAHSLEGVKIDNIWTLLRELVKRNPKMLFSLAKMFI